MNSNTTIIPILAEFDSPQLGDTDTHGEIMAEKEPLVSDSTAFYVEVLVYVTSCGLVSVAGIIANIINIIVFIRQGVFTTGGSPTLLGLSVSDLCSVASMLWLSISFAIVLANPPGLSWEPWDVQYLSGWPHLMFGQITRMVTAYMAFERCVCVVFPFKVKSLFTPERTIMIITSIFVGVMITYSPVFILHRFEFKTDIYTNTTRWILVAYPGLSFAMDVVVYYASIICNLGSVAIVLICTMITVSRIKISKGWRESIATTTKSSNERKTVASSEESSNNKTGHVERSSKLQRERKLVKMISLISVVFLLCYVPDMCNVVMYSTDPEIAPFGAQENLSMLMHSLTFLLETVNSTVNIVIYYTMSTRYRQEFNALFGLKSPS